MKLPQISGGELIKVLCKFGFGVVRQKGSHVRLEKRLKGQTIKLTVPMHHKLKKGTLSRIIKDSKISEEEFSKLLQGILGLNPSNHPDKNLFKFSSTAFLNIYFPLLGFI